MRRFEVKCDECNGTGKNGSCEWCEGSGKKIVTTYGQEPIGVIKELVPMPSGAGMIAKTTTVSAEPAGAVTIFPSVTYGDLPQGATIERCQYCGSYILKV